MDRNEAAALLLMCFYLYFYIQTMNGIRKELKRINEEVLDYKK